jgi:hypothetical protein
MKLERKWLSSHWQQIRRIQFSKEGIAFFFVQESQAKSAWRRWLAFIASARKYSKKGAALLIGPKTFSRFHRKGT